MTYPVPTYLNGLVTEVNEPILLEIQKAYGENTTAFKFNINFTALTQTWSEEFAEYGGTIFGIDKANNQTTIFDQFRNGYNGVMEINEEEDLNSTKSMKTYSGLHTWAIEVFMKKNIKR